VSHLPVVEPLDIPEIGLAVEDDPTFCPLVRLLVEELLQVGDAGGRVQVDKAQVHLQAICGFVQLGLHLLKPLASKNIIFDNNFSLKLFMANVENFVRWFLQSAS
jgi:hypothetical protein